MRIDLTKKLFLSMAIAAVGIAHAKEFTLPDPDTQDDCAPAQCIEVNERYELRITSGPYPDGCYIYSLSVPDGRRLVIGIRDFTIDLDMYVDRNLTVLQYEDHGQWTSNEYGNVNESVTITNPGGQYYIQICSYVPDAGESNFTLYSVFTPIS